MTDEQPAPAPPRPDFSFYDSRDIEDLYDEMEKATAYIERLEATLTVVEANFDECIEDMAAVEKQRDELKAKLEQAMKAKVDYGQKLTIVQQERDDLEQRLAGCEYALEQERALRRAANDTAVPR